MAFSPALPSRMQISSGNYKSVIKIENGIFDISNYTIDPSGLAHPSDNGDNEANLSFGTITINGQTLDIAANLSPYEAILAVPGGNYSGAGLAKLDLTGANQNISNANFSVASGGTLIVDGATTLSSTLDVSGAAILSSTLGVTGAASLSSTLNVVEAATLSSTLGVSGAAILSSTLNVDGAATLSSTLGVFGAANLSSTLNVDGAAILSSTLGVTGAASLSSTLNVDGAATLTSTLDVSGAATLQNTLNVTGAADFNFTLDVGAAATFDSTLSVSGAATFDAAVGVNNGSNITLDSGDVLLGAISVKDKLNLLNNVASYLANYFNSTTTTLFGYAV